jgi:hypothetical protein
MEQKKANEHDRQDMIARRSNTEEAKKEGGCNWDEQEQSEDYDILIRGVNVGIEFNQES